MSAIGSNAPTIGLIPDILARLRATTAPWFPDPSNAPVLTALQTAQADQFAFVYAYLKNAANQTRIATATGGWLDMIAWDFFGARFLRRPGEPDVSFASRIIQEVLRPRQTRAALIELITQLVGTPPQLTEAWNPGDIGAYGVQSPIGTMQGYGISGEYGSLQFPNQIFITMLQPPTSGIPNVTGYGYGLGGYGVKEPANIGNGAFVYGDISQVQGLITDAEIYARIAQTIAAGTIAWVDIVGAFAIPKLGPGMLPPWTGSQRARIFADIVAAWQPPDPDARFGGAQQLTLTKVNPSIIAVPPQPPIPNLFFWDTQAQIVALSQPPDPQPFVGGRQPAGRPDLNPFFTNNPPTPGMPLPNMDAVSTMLSVVTQAWQPPDPTPLYWQPYGPKRLPPSFLNNPTPPFPYDERAITNKMTPVLQWQTNLYRPR